MKKINCTGVLVAISVSLILSACSKPAIETAPTAQNSPPATVTIMTFNVENLFDNSDDPGKYDSTFLPLEAKQSDEHKAACGQIKVERWRNQCLDWDWSDEIIDRKLSAVAGTILQVNDGRGPDILALQEVENIAILERLRTDYLGDAGYHPAILIEGHDIRGIDVAFLSRLPLAEEPRLHSFPTEGIDEERRGDTRGILEATFRLPDGALLTGFSVHFPAPFHPTGMRETAYTQLNQLKSSLPAGRMAFAAGDFNTTSREDREQDMLQRFARPLWSVVHDQGCPNCKGSQYYARDNSWSYLDMILWSPAEISGADTTWAIRAGSFAIANNGPGQTRSNHTPARFELPDGGGVSDHWPLIFTIELK
jgi:endonuclease/exonuclease/phosphatase family metal-dependent hydrolase